MSEAQDMDRDQLAALVEQKGGDFYALFDRATDLESPNTIGTWSLRDLLAHIVAWNEECLWAFSSTIEGNYERRDYSDVNGWNAAAVSRLEGLDGKDLLARARSSNRDIAAKIREIPEELWKTKRRLQVWPWNTTVRHFDEHEADVRKAIGDRQ